MAILKIKTKAGDSFTALPDPKSMTVLLQDIDASTTTRSANGTMLRDRIVGGDTAKRKIEIEWPPVNSAKARDILQAMKAEFFYLDYPDPYTGENRTAQFYTGDRSVPMYNYNLHGNGILWEQIKVNLIEK